MTLSYIYMTQNFVTYVLCFINISIMTTSAIWRDKQFVLY